MRSGNDALSKKILELVRDSDEPFETMEIVSKIKDTTRMKILYRLYLLRGDDKIKGKQVGSGKGAWIWWQYEE